MEYESADGTHSIIPADTVVIAVGYEPRLDEAIALYGITAETVMVGDCVKSGHLAHAMRSAYAAASQI